MKRGWGWVGLLAVTATAGYLCRVNVTVAGAQMMTEFGLTQAELGRAFSAFLLGYTIFMAPGGLLADRYGPRLVLLVSAMGWVAGTALTAAAGGLAALFAARFVTGAIQAPLFPAAAKGVSLWIQREAAARGNGLILAAIGAGSAVAPPLVTWAMMRWGWRDALFVSAVPAILVALVWGLKREPQPVQDVNTKGGGQGFRDLWSKDYALLALSYTVQGYTGYIFVFWFYLYLVQERRFDLLAGALWSSLPWALSIISIPAGGWLSDRLAKSAAGSQWGKRAVPMAGLIGSGVMLGIGARTESAVTAAVALAVSTALVLSVEGPFWAAMTEISGARSGLGGGVMNTGCNIGGMISPALTPWLAAKIGWGNALLLAAAAAIAGGLLWLGIRPQRRS